MNDTLYTDREAAQIETTREALIEHIRSIGHVPAREAYLGGACDLLRRSLDKGETRQYTEEALMAICIQAMYDMLERRKGDQRIANEIRRYVGHPKLKCDRNRVYRLRKKYNLGDEPPVAVRPPSPGSQLPRAHATSLPAETLPAPIPPANVTPPAGPDEEAAGATSPSADTSTLLGDPHYIERDADQLIKQLAASPAETLVIHAPPGFGKTSLLGHYMLRASAHGQRIISVDLFNIKSSMTEYPKVLESIAQIILHGLGLGPAPRRPLTTSLDFTHFIEDEVLKPIGPQPVIIALDHPEQFANKAFKDDFFYMLRIWHNNRGKYARNNPWRSVGLAITTSLDPVYFIEDANRSPFAIGKSASLSEFSHTDYREWNKRYETGLDDDGIDRLFDRLRGHPRMTRLAFERLSESSQSLEELCSPSAASPQGPFWPHLASLPHRLRLVYQAQHPGAANSADSLLKKFRDFSNKWRSGSSRSSLDEHRSDQHTFDEREISILIDTGLIRDSENVEPWCPVYVDHFANSPS